MPLWLIKNTRNMNENINISLLQQVIEFLGTFAFAISGIRHAAAKEFDWFGGYVCGVKWPG